MRRAEPVSTIFLDFDGLLVDTESVSERAWRESFLRLDVPFPADQWQALIGSQGSGPRLADLLVRASQVGDAGSVLVAWRIRQNELLADVGPRQGVVEFLSTVRAAGLSSWVVSSATSDWVLGQLERSGLASLVDGVTTGDGIPPKPDPAGYLAALRACPADPNTTIAFEDSPHGVTAARAAGIRCVAIPNPVTSRLVFDHADAVVTSFEEVRLDVTTEWGVRITFGPAGPG